MVLLGTSYEAVPVLLSSRTSFIFPFHLLYLPRGSPYRILFLYLLKLPCHIYLFVIEQQQQQECANYFERWTNPARPWQYSTAYTSETIRPYNGFNFGTHRKIFSKSYLFKPKSDCIYHFPIDLENGKYNLISGRFNEISKKFLCMCPLWTMEYATLASERWNTPHVLHNLAGMPPNGLGSLYGNISYEAQLQLESYFCQMFTSGCSYRNLIWTYKCSCWNVHFSNVHIQIWHPNLSNIHIQISQIFVSNPTWKSKKIYADCNQFTR